MTTYQDDHDPEPFTARPTPGGYYLQGFADGYHNRPKEKQDTKEAGAAYTKGYKHGVHAAKHERTTG